MTGLTSTSKFEYFSPGLQAPGLAVVLVGERKDSQTYVRSKKRACEEVGIVSFGTELDADVSEDEVLEVVREYNANQDVHGILVQLPLPKHMNEQTILDAIDISKDVDGFHPLNIGCLAMRGREPRYVSCTPKGCMELLKRNNIELSVRNSPPAQSNAVQLPFEFVSTAYHRHCLWIHLCVFFYDFKGFSKMLALCFLCNRLSSCAPRS